MFTGLVQTVGNVVSTQKTAAGTRLVIDPAGWDHLPERGASISVCGCCLTLAEAVGPGEPWPFDAIPETLAKTTLGGFGAGTKVNLEHAATASTLLGGHIVQGHVDGLAEVVSVKTEGEWRVRLRPPADLMKFVAPKGSVCLDGVSLTVADLDQAAGWFEVALIPETLNKTTLDGWAAGQRVNFEADSMAKTVVNYLENYLQHRQV
ncbi:MAG: riboflavin synthase [Planctomycetota bacterium]